MDKPNIIKIVAGSAQLALSLIGGTTVGYVTDKIVGGLVPVPVTKFQKAATLIGTGLVSGALSSAAISEISGDISSVEEFLLEIFDKDVEDDDSEIVYSDFAVEEVPASA